MKPNIFNYATSELSQDAVLCWMFDWANFDNKIMKDFAKDFIKLIFECIKHHTSIIEEEKFFNDENIENSIYSIEHNLNAIKNASELNMIIDDYDDRYFDDKFILQEAQQE